MNNRRQHAEHSNERKTMKTKTAIIIITVFVALSIGQSAFAQTPVCGDKVQLTEPHSVWCLKWGFLPWRCTETRTVTKYRYDFLPWRSNLSWPFHCSYEGCCGTRLYKWSNWCWSG